MTPSEAIVATATMTWTVADANGRYLTIRRMTALDKLRLFKAAGPHLAQNQPWLGMAVLACSVVALDDVPVPLATCEQHIEAIVSRLGDAGIAAAADALGAGSLPDAPDMAISAGN
jgi:hypothetical protein